MRDDDDDECWVEETVMETTHPEPLRACKTTMSPSFTLKLTSSNIGSPSGQTQERFFTASSGAISQSVLSKQKKRPNFLTWSASFSRNGPDKPSLARIARSFVCYE